MKKEMLIAFTAIVMLASSVIAEEDPYADQGGLIIKPPVGYVAVINCGTDFDSSAISGFFFPQGQCMKIPYRIFNDSKPFSVGDAESRLNDLKANSAIFIGNDPTLPMSLTAVEAKWTFINYGRLIADNPGGELVNRRMDKMFSRATMAILGGGSFMNFPMSATKRVNSITDLDRLEGRSPSPFAMMSMSAYIDELGIKFEQESTYEQACQEGWAPAPTNEIQKAIWREIHTPPTKPLKITYDKDKQKPVVK